MAEMHAYIATYTHPRYPQRKTIVNARSLAEARTTAGARVDGTQWALVAVKPFTLAASDED